MFIAYENREPVVIEEVSIDLEGDLKTLVNNLQQLIAEHGNLTYNVYGHDDDGRGIPELFVRKVYKIPEPVKNVYIEVSDNYSKIEVAIRKIETEISMHSNAAESKRRDEIHKQEFVPQGIIFEWEEGYFPSHREVTTKCGELRGFAAKKGDKFVVCETLQDKQMYMAEEGRKARWAAQQQKVTEYAEVLSVLRLQLDEWSQRLKSAEVDVFNSVKGALK